MMRRIDGFWRALASVPGLRALKVQWEEQLGQDTETGWRFLRPTGERAESYPCPCPGGDGCPREVIVYSPDDVVAVCGNRPWECPPLELRELDLLVYELDLRDFALEVGTALGFNGKPEQIDAVTWKLGSRGTRRAFVTIPFGSESFFRVAMHLSTPPCLLLAPTREICSHETVQLMEARDSFFLALADLLEIDDGGQFVLSRSGRSLWSASTTAEEPENVFRKEGKVWTLRFSGQTARLKDRVGLSYLKVLLGAPNQEIHVSEVVATAGQEGDDSRVPVLAGGDEVLDKKTVSNLESALRDLEDLKAEASADHDIERVQDLDGEISRIKSELHRASGLHGRPRILGSEIAKERKRVTAAIKRAIADIHEEHESLGQHLSAFVKTGEYLSYRPDADISWLTL